MKLSILNKKLILVVLGVLFTLFVLKILLFLMAKPKIKINYVVEYNTATRPLNYDPNNNATKYYQKSLDAFVGTPHELRISHQNWPEDFNSNEQKLLEDWLILNSQAFAYFKNATDMPYYWIERDSKKDDCMIDIPLSDLASLRQLNDVLLWDAKIKALKGQLRPAFEDILVSYKAGKHKCQPNSFIVEQLTGLKFKKDAMYNAFIILDKTKYDSVTLEYFQDALQNNLDKDLYTPDIWAEKIINYDILQRIFVDVKNDSGRLYFKAAFDLIPMCSGLRHYKVFFNCFTGPTKSEVENQINKIVVISQEVMPKTPWQIKNDTNNYFKEIQNINNSNFFLKTFGINIKSICYSYHEQKAQAKALITVLAILRFKAETGKFPQSLQELISSDYLKELPQDPYSDKPLVYKLKENNFTLYSVGEDFEDNGGDSKESTEKKTTIVSELPSTTFKDHPADIVYWPVRY